MVQFGNIEDFSRKSPQVRGEEEYNQTFWDLFNLYVGKDGKRFTPKEISSATGISKDTIENWTQKISAPNFSNLMILCKFLPCEFKSRFIALLGGGDVVAEVRDNYAEILEELALKVRGGEI